MQSAPELIVLISKKLKLNAINRTKMHESKMEELKNKVEAVLFSSGKKMSVEEIARLCRTTAVTIIQQLQELKNDYDSKNSSLLLIDEGDGWKLTVREQYSSVVRKIVAETELTKTMMETLAVIAWKAPVLQSGIIKVRTNKAYDHLRELESSGFISREKHGRTKLLRLTERFFNYFDLRNAEEVKEKFRVEEAKGEPQAASSENVQQVSPEGESRDSEETC